MSEAATKLLEDRIRAIVDRVKALAEERDALRSEIDAMRSRLEETEATARAERHRDLERLQGENARLRAALEDAVRELRED